MITSYMSYQQKISRQNPNFEAKNSCGFSTFFGKMEKKD
jgi:hypothetical protein